MASRKFRLLLLLLSLFKMTMGSVQGNGPHSPNSLTMRGQVRKGIPTVKVGNKRTFEAFQESFNQEQSHLLFPDEAEEPPKKALFAEAVHFMVKHFDETHFLFLGAILLKLAFFAVIIYSLLFPTILSVDGGGGGDSKGSKGRTLPLFQKRHSIIRNGQVELHSFRSHHRAARQVADSEECMRRIICELSRSGNSVWTSENPSDFWKKYPCDAGQILSRMYNMVNNFKKLMN